jgi:hypothetical protein
MANVSSIVKQLRNERDRVTKQLSGMDAALMAFANVYSNGQHCRKRRPMSVAARRKIGVAQRRVGPGLGQNGNANHFYTPA